MTKLSRLTGALAVLLATSAFAPAFADRGRGARRAAENRAFEGPGRRRPDARWRSVAERRGAGQDQGDEGDGGDRHALRRQRLVARPDRRPEGPVRQDGHRGDRRHRCRLQAGEAGRRHRDRDGAEPGHHRLDPDRPGRHRRRLQGRRRPGREDRLHGQRARGHDGRARTMSAWSPPTTTATASPRRT